MTLDNLALGIIFFLLCFPVAVAAAYMETRTRSLFRRVAFWALAFAWFALIGAML